MNCKKCGTKISKDGEYETIRNLEGYNVLCGKCSNNLTKWASKAKKKIALKKEDILKYGTKEEVEFLKEAASNINKSDIFFRAHMAVEKLHSEYADDPNADPEWINGALEAIGYIVDIFTKTLSREVAALPPSEKQDDVKLLYKAESMLQRKIEEYADDPNVDPEWTNGAIDATVAFGEKMGIDLDDWVEEVLAR